MKKKFILFHFGEENVTKKEKKRENVFIVYFYEVFRLFYTGKRKVCNFMIPA